MDMHFEQIAEISRPIFADDPLVKLAYLFGSRANDSAGPLSDFDFAVYVDTRDTGKMFDIKLGLVNALMSALGTDKVDVVVLNATQQPELKYNIITSGRVIYEVEPFRIIAEPKILNEYFDFHALLQKYKLTNA